MRREIDDVRPLTAADLDWVVGLTRSRRERLAPHAPRFWRPAADAAQRHRAYLANLIDDPSATALRTDHGYLVAVTSDRRRVVDDMVVAEDAWPEEGVALLEHLLADGGRVRFVVPVFERARRDAAEAVGLVPATAWWHRDLPVVRVTRDGGRVQLDAPGASGRLVPAPPVYDPGGSVLLVTDLDSADALTAIESEAAERGATVSVVSVRPDDLMRELLLVGAGHVLTTLFYERRPDLV